MERKMRLREWLVAQVHGGRYAGLRWEEDGVFRIPWKHASKQDYRQSEDAALFKAWAMYKGKYREGQGRDDPTVWKTRLRCALNKSTDFQEVPERSQQDIAEPYKVYRVLGHAAPDQPAAAERIIQATRSILPARSPDLLKPQLGDQRESCEGEEAGKANDVCMRVRLLYLGQLVAEVVTTSPDGCFILQGAAPLGSERLYGPCSAQTLSFPSPSRGPLLQAGGVEAMERLLPHLERGVLLWVAPEGVFIKRFCQGRVYWSGPLARHTDGPNKLERERTCKLLDTPVFLKELHHYLQGDGPAPCYEIELCFGEEFPDPNISKTKKLVIVQVVPLFAVKLLQDERRRRHPERGEEEEEEEEKKIGGGGETQREERGEEDEKTPRERRGGGGEEEETPRERRGGDTLREERRGGEERRRRGGEDTQREDRGRRRTRRHPERGGGEEEETPRERR